MKEDIVHDAGIDIPDCSNASAIDRPCKITRLEVKNKVIFRIFKILGLFLIRWDEGEQAYVVLKIRFFLFYTFWFIWPLVGLGIALLGRKMFNSDDGLDRVNNFMESALFILGFAVIPAIKTYSLKLVTKCLPDVLEEIVSLQELKVGFKTPLNIHLPSRPQRPDAPRTAVHRGYQKRLTDPEALFKILPILTVVLSVVAFVVSWIYGLTEAVEWDAIKQEWSFFTMQFTYLTLPCITTWFSVIFIEWLRMVYEKLRIEADNRLGSLLETSQGISPESDQRTITLDQEKIEEYGEYVTKLQEIFITLSNGFISYVLGLNFTVSILSAVFCTSKLLQGFQQVMYVIPLSVALYHMGLVCNKSHALMDEYESIVLILKQLLRRRRKNPEALPYDQLHILRENLLESPPQVVTFGEYRVSNGLLLATYSFIISYAMLINDIIGLQNETTDPPTCNYTTQ
ncbi:uncharacterized protein [Panulirus ornatus]|uniref:uncharacterized protein n=1 Tax=Panulirus ornatus TaxID=150431 RepID=UPI003A85FF91